MPTFIKRIKFIFMPFITSIFMLFIKIIPMPSIKFIKLVFALVVALVTTSSTKNYVPRGICPGNGALFGW